MIFYVPLAGVKRRSETIDEYQLTTFTASVVVFIFVFIYMK